MQLRQSETICSIDDDGVCGRYVDAAFNDCGAKQNIDFILPWIQKRIDLGPMLSTLVKRIYNETQMAYYIDCLDLVYPDRKPEYYRIET